MPITRRRRIVRRAVMALAVVVLVPVGYVGSYCTLAWLGGRAEYDPRLDQMRLWRLKAVIHAPILQYEMAELPGSATLEALEIWCHYQGKGTPIEFGDILQGVVSFREQQRE